MVLVVCRHETNERIFSGQSLATDNNDVYKNPTRTSRVYGKLLMNEGTRRLRSAQYCR